MTVSSTVISAGPYSGNGVTTTFAYPFKITAKTEMIVYKTDGNGDVSTLVVDTDYTVAGVGDEGGGSITLVAGALASGHTLDIVADYPLTQETDLNSQGGFFPDVHEDAFDKLTRIAQQQNRQTDLLKTRATSLESRATDLEDRATSLESRATSLEGRATTAESDIDNLDGRMDTAETDIDTNAAGLAQEIVDRAAADTALQNQINTNTSTLARALRFPEGDATSPTLPSLEERRNTLAGYGPGGAPTANTITFATLTGGDVSVGSIAALRGMPVVAGSSVIVQGYYTAGDGGGGPVRVGKTGEAPGTYVDNGGSVIVPTGGDGSAAWVWTWIGPINARWAGANTSLADNADAINAAILSLGNDGVVYIPAGVWMASQIVLTPGVTLRGDGPGYTYIKQISGLTSPLLVDSGSSANAFLKDISFDGNNNTIASALVYLGHTIQMGTVGGLQNVFVRNVVGNGLDINGNVCYFDTVETHFCTGTGFVIRGAGNSLKNITFSNIGTTGIDLKCHTSTLDSVFGETSYTNALVNVSAEFVGNKINGVHAYLDGGNDADSIVRINTNCFLTTVANVTANINAGAGSTATNGLIYDTTTGTRKVWGTAYANYWAVQRYESGARIQLPYNLSGVPTVGTHLKGDWFAAGGANDGSPTGFICTVAGSPGTWAPLGTTVGYAANKTASEALLVTDNGKRLSNNGAAAIVTLTLPVAVAGMRFHFTRRNATYALRIDPNGSDFLPPAGFGKYVSLDTDGTSITIESPTAGNWVVTAQSGTISFEP